MFHQTSAFNFYIQKHAVSQVVRFYTVFSGFGEVTEWLKVLAWNAGVVKATEGSNPSLTAISYIQTRKINIWLLSLYFYSQQIDIFTFEDKK